MSVIDDVREKLDIVAVIEEYVSLKKSGRNFSAPCPFHNETKPSFIVFPDSQRWHCFGACGEGGDIFSFVMKKEGMEFGEALKVLARKAGVVLQPKADQVKRQAILDTFAAINATACTFFQQGLPQVMKYLSERGISEASAVKFQLGYSGGDLMRHLKERGVSEERILEAGLANKNDAGTYNRFINRLIFPIADAHGKIVGFGGRSMDGHDPKYLNTSTNPVFDKGSILYGFDKARTSIRDRNLVVVVEGYMDVIMAHQYGETNVVAAMGTSLSEAQLGLLKPVTRNVVMAMDADVAGKEAAVKMVGRGPRKVTHTFLGAVTRYESVLENEVRVAVLPDGKDPDEVIRQDKVTWQRLIIKAVPVTEYAIKLALEKGNKTTVAGKSAIVKQVLPIINDVRDSFRQSLYLDRLAYALEVPKESLIKSLGKLQENKREWVKLPSVDHEPEAINLALEHGWMDQLKPEYFEVAANAEVVRLWPGPYNALLQEYVDSVVSTKKPTLLDSPERIFALHLALMQERYWKRRLAKATDLDELNEITSHIMEAREARKAPVGG